jgi:hypothetical protein
MSKKQPHEVGTAISAAALDTENMLSDTSVDPRDIVRAAISRIANLSFASVEREREAAAVLSSYSTRFKKLVQEFDLNGLRIAVGEMESRIRPFTSPKPTPTFQDQLREGAMGRFYAVGWSTEEVEYLRFLHRHPEVIGEITPSSVMLGGREVKRAEVRERMKGIFNPQQLKGYAEKEARGVNTAAANRERREQGKAPLPYS